MIHTITIVATVFALLVAGGCKPAVPPLAKGKVPGMVYSMAYEQERVFVVTSEGAFEIDDTSLRVLRSFPALEARCCAMSEGRLIVGGQSGRVVIFDAESGAVLYRKTIGAKDVLAAASVSKRGMVALDLGEDHPVVYMAIDDGSVVRDVEDFPGFQRGIPEEVQVFARQHGVEQVEAFVYADGIVGVACAAEVFLECQEIAFETEVEMRSTIRSLLVVGENLYVVSLGGEVFRYRLE